MLPFVVPTRGTVSWQELLADPEKQWRTGYSARSMAHCWEESRGFPKCVQAVLQTADEPALRDPELLIGIPEHQVPLPGGSRPSQTDLWVLARAGDDLISIAVEGKVSEAFGPTIDEWLVEASGGKRQRLAFLHERLGLKAPVPGEIRYQLLHRTASALIEAERFGARHALMLVHSFSQSCEWLEDYQKFASLYGTEAQAGQIVTCRSVDGIQLSLGWATGDARWLSA